MHPKLPQFLISLALAFSLLLAPAGAWAQQGEGPVYVVQAGDTLSGIARTFGTSVQALMEANGLSGSDRLQPGQELRIPGFEGVTGRLQRHTLGLGETLRSLAWRSGAGLKDLERLNRVLNPDRLYVGQGVILPVAQENAAAMPDAELELVVEGETGLGRAAARGENPWLERLRAGAGGRMWLAPGELRPVPGEAGQGFSHLPRPLLALEIDPLTARQGTTVVVRAEVSEAVELQGDLGEWRLNFVTPAQGERLALQGVHALAEPGLHLLSLQVLDDGGAVVYAFDQPYPVRTGNYGFDPVLYVPEPTINPENTEPENERVRAILAQVSPVKHWQGPFAFPSDYFTDSFPSVFGTRRNYNDTGYNFYHSGLDFYGGTGVEVLAPAAGTVVLADELTVRGNTTIIDHGWGVFTMYMHQSEITVEDGEQVAVGQVIGYVGATGRATGPHLHWEVVVGGIPVQPLDWIERPYP